MSTTADPLPFPFALPEPQRLALQEAYATPPRAYHNFQHVQEVLRHYGEVAQGPGWRQPVEVALAVLYHDAIYEAGRRDNETRSAELAVAHIGRWLPALGVDARRVMELIEMTARRRVRTGRRGRGSSAVPGLRHGHPRKRADRVRRL